MSVSVHAKKLYFCLLRVNENAKRLFLLLNGTQGQKIRLTHYAG